MSQQQYILKNFKQSSLTGTYLPHLCLNPNHNEMMEAMMMSVAGIMFNTGIGQHILKNPLIVNSIIEKVRSPASLCS